MGHRSFYFKSAAPDHHGFPITDIFPWSGLIAVKWKEFWVSKLHFF
uniref:Uncharacterized protein n=1 Tax=Rhizophora mucronata TaxID=61149 RepID=A0A2P2NTH5_RHIMU